MRKLRNAEIPRIDPSDGDLPPRHPVVAVVEDVRSIYNVGSMFRSADAMWIEKLYLTGITGTPAHRGLHKTALGAQDTMPWEHRRDAQAVLAELRAAGYTIAVLEITDEPTPVDAVEQHHFPLALVVGNEVTGVSEALVEQADLALEIPQHGTKQSLNVAVAFGIAAHQLVSSFRQFHREA